MNRLTTCAFVFFLGCGGGSIEVPEPATPEAAPGAPAAIQLSADAIRRAGIAIEPVRLVEAPVIVSLPGQVRFDEDRSANVASFVEGVVTECCKAVGEFVKAGDVLVELHSHQTHEILGEYRKALATLEARRSELRLAQQAEGRARRLLELQAVSERELQEAETRREVAEQSVDAARADIESALAHFEYLGVETTELRKGAVVDHLRILVRSPINGFVVERTVTPGGVVTPSDDLYRVSDVGRLWVVARAPEQQLSGLAVGMRATVRVRALPDREVAGRVIRIADELDAETKTVQVVVSVSNPDRSLKVGMFGDVALRGDRSEQVLAVPEGAVQLVDGQSTLFVESTAGTFVPTTVEVGRSFAALEEIASGVGQGDKIVVGGAFALKSELLKTRFAEE